MDLPGHADEVFSVDWSPGGDKVASGGKDRVVKISATFEVNEDEDLAEYENEQQKKKKQKAKPKPAVK
ncbi:hypothetical protein HDU80_003884, partial [Chytriomyces hyalinus]